MAQGSTAEELIGRIADRQQEALGELYDHMAPGLLGMLFRILSDRDAAEEILQEVFLRLWNEARRLEQERISVSAWLVFVARHTAVGRRRAGRKLPAIVRGDPELYRKSLSWLPRPDEVALLEQRRELLRKVINQLPKPQRTAVELAVFDGYTQQEIAQMLVEPLGKVKAGLRAGMQFLRHRRRAVLGKWAANI